MKLINRSALLVCPRQPYVDWVNGLARELTELENPMSLAQQQREGRVYLVDEQQRMEELEAALEQCWRPIFENELSGWDEFADHWPKPLSRALFDRWFRVEPQLMTFDLSPGPLLVAELDQVGL